MSEIKPKGVCKDCPFVRSNPLMGSPDWLEEILTFDRKNKYFRHTCHKTDPNADGYSGTKKVKECRGYLTLIMNEIDETPGKHGVYNSIDEMAKTYISHWLEKSKEELFR